MNEQIDARPITNDDWDAIARLMDRPYGRATLRIDGFEITILQGVHKRKIETGVFVNGKCKGKWHDFDDHGKPEPKHEEAKRFYQIRSKRLWKAPLKDLEKAFGKRKAREMKAVRYHYVLPVWKSANSMLKHFETHNKEILFQGIETI